MSAKLQVSNHVNVHDVYVCVTSANVKSNDIYLYVTRSKTSFERTKVKVIRKKKHQTLSLSNYPCLNRVASSPSLWGVACMTWPQSLQPCFSVSAMSPPWTADTSYSPCHTNMAWAIWHESYHMLSIFELALRQQSERNTLTRPWRSPRNAMPTEIHGCKPDQSGQFQTKCLSTKRSCGHVPWINLIISSILWYTKDVTAFFSLLYN